MDSSTLSAVLAWFGAHPIAACALAFLIAFGDALVIVGVAVPAIPLLFGIGTLIGMGHIDGGYVLACATLGAFCGDGLSYWVGHRFGPQLRQRWPFSRHPAWLDHGEGMFRRHGMKSIVLARYVGAVRPFVPAIAGMLHMPLRKYGPASAVAALLWSATFLAPGWALGASLEIVQAVAGRLSVVVGVLLAVLALIWASVFYLYRWLAPRAAQLLERALAWSHRHPVLGRYSEALIDPHQRESASLLLMALLLIGAGWGLFSLLIVLSGHGDPLALDLAVHQAMFALRTPLADSALALLASLGDWQVLVPAALLVFVFLLWRRRWIAAGHWLAALSFGLVLTTALGWLLDVPKPPAATAVAGFGFPSATVTMATVMFGFFAVLIARELPGRRRVWPYVVGALIVTAIGFARLYLGAHWLSDVLGGVLLGMCWTALLGIAYRRRVVRSLWVAPIAALFFGAFALSAGIHAPRHVLSTLDRFDPPLVRSALPIDAWWSQEWETDLPARRNQFQRRSAWPLNVQYAGDIQVLQRQLESQGWRTVTPGGWAGLLLTLDDDVTPATLPVLSAAHRGRAEVLMMEHTGSTPETRRVLRVWATPYVLEPAAAGIPDAPLWVGSVQTLRFTRRLDFVSYWNVLPGDVHARGQLRRDVGDMPRRESRRDDAAVRVLRLRQAELGTAH